MSDARRRAADSLGGWSPDEVVALAGVYILLGGIIGVMIQPSMEEVIESVREGTLDCTLTKPEEAQLLVSIQEFDIREVLNIVLGLGVLSVALARLGETVVPGQAAVFGAMTRRSHRLFLLADPGGVVVLVPSHRELPGRLSERPRSRPLAGEHLSWVSALRADAIIPVAFAVTVPAEALTGVSFGRWRWRRLAWRRLLLVVSRVV